VNGDQEHTRAQRGAGEPTAEEVEVRVDRTRCVGSGLCAATAPDDFELDDAGKSRPCRPVGPVSEGLRDAAEMCPVEAISVVSIRTGRRVAPLG
jgi:ferredoxin